MVRRSTWIFIAIFAVLVGFAYFLQRYQANKTDTAATATPTSAPVSLYTFDSSQVKDIKIVDKAGKMIDLYRDATGTKWAAADIPAAQTDTAQIDTISTQLFGLEAQDTLTQTLPLATIGLDSPAYTITLTTSDNAQTVTKIGDQTPIGSGYYVQVNSGPISIVDKVTLDDILGLLTKPPIIPTPTPSPSPTETPAPTVNETSGTATP